jgi:branched-chain amino acid transport system substrate-binding protein
MTRKILILVALLLVGGVIVYGLWKQTPNNNPPIIIGAILGLSGKDSYVGENIKAGIDLAVDTINNSDQINGRAVKIEYGDSQSGAKTGLNAYQKLKNINRIKLFLVSRTGVALGIAPVAEKDKNILFAVGVADPSITYAGDYIFRHSVYPSDEMEFMAETIAHKFNQTSAAILSVNNAGGDNLVAEFSKFYQARGGAITINEKFDEGGSDVRTQLLKIKNTGVKSALTIAHAPDLGLILKQARELNLNIQWFDMYGAEDQKLVDIAGSSAEGVVYTFFYDPAASSTAIQNFASNFQTRFGRAPDYYAALAYDNIIMLATALKNCTDPNDTVCIKNQLYQIKNYSGASGQISIDQNGDTHKSIFLKTVQDGKFVKYQ